MHASAVSVRTITWKLKQHTHANSPNLSACWSVVNLRPTQDHLLILPNVWPVVDLFPRWDRCVYLKSKTRERNERRGRRQRIKNGTERGTEEAHTTGGESGALPGKGPCPSSWQGRKKETAGPLGVGRGAGELRNLSTAISIPWYLDFLWVWALSLVTSHHDCAPLALYPLSFYISPNGQI